MNKWSKRWDCLYRHFIIKDEFNHEEKLTNEILLKQAGQELNQARNVLSRVEDLDMVDYAIFSLKAAEKRYDYLLKKIKEK